MQAAVELIYILEEYTRLPKEVGLSPKNARSAKRRVGAEVRASGANEVRFASDNSMSPKGVFPSGTNFPVGFISRCERQ
ncbi:MAG: hypothetical protein L6R35_005734 [Caloplaca aegaea]|nr:MAG: hypothetical protein L6R35_005734 [Caloplaca aegaea]